MKKKILQPVLIICFLLILLPMSVFGKNADRAQLQLGYLSNYGIAFDISPKGNANITAYVYGNGETKSTYIHLILQQQTKPNHWDKIMSWRVFPKTRCANVVETYALTKGTYRIKAILKANEEEKILYSDVLTFE